MDHKQYWKQKWEGYMARHRVTRTDGCDFETQIGMLSENSFLWLIELGVINDDGDILNTKDDNGVLKWSKFCEVYYYLRSVPTRTKLSEDEVVRLMRYGKIKRSYMEGGREYIEKVTNPIPYGIEDQYKQIRKEAEARMAEAKKRGNKKSTQAVDF